MANNADPLRVYRGDWHTRWMIRSDLPDVLEIESHSLAPRWAEDDFLLFLRQRDCIGMVIERNETIDGFMIYALQPGYLRLHNFAVRPERRRMGLGRRILKRLVEKLNSNRRQSIQLTLREDNWPAVCLLKSAGFRACRLMKGIYADGEIDGYEMEYHVENQPDPAAVAGELLGAL